MANYMWNAGAGDFDAAKNWEVSGAVPAQPPGPGDYATFDAAGIVVTGTGTAQRLIFYTAQIQGQDQCRYGRRTSMYRVADRPRHDLVEDGRGRVACRSGIHPGDHVHR